VVSDRIGLVWMGLDRKTVALPVEQTNSFSLSVCLSFFALPSLVRASQIRLIPQLKWSRRFGSPISQIERDICIYMGGMPGGHFKYLSSVVAKKLVIISLA